MFSINVFFMFYTYLIYQLGHVFYRGFIRWRFLGIIILSLFLSVQVLPLHGIRSIQQTMDVYLTHLCPPLRSIFAVRETASLGIMRAPRVPHLNPSETIVLSEHYRL